MNLITSQTPPAQLREHIRACLGKGQLAAAQEALEALLAQVPNDTVALIDLADVLFRRGSLQASCRPLLRAASRLPRNVPLILSLTQHLILRGETSAGRACLDLVAQAPSPPAEALFLQANLRFMIGQIREALDPAERAIREGLDTPGGWRLYAMLLQFNGRIDAARKVLEECLAKWPLFGDAAPVLVDLRKQTPDGNYLKVFQDRLEELPTEPADRNQAFVRAEFEYAVFKTLDDLGQYDEAWQSLARCNELMHRLNPYNREVEEAVTDALIGFPVADSAGGGRGLVPEGPTPIFIVGMPRSGTTLLDRMLSSHSQVTSAGEIVDFWRQFHWMADVIPAGGEGLMRAVERSHDLDFEQLGRRYLEQTQWRAEGRSYYIDKLPGNIQLIAFIRRALPHAPILHMVRDPVDTCFSNFKAMFGNISSYSYDLDSLAHYYNQYARLAAHWHEALPGAMLDVNFAELVRSPQTVIGQVLAHCKLEVEEACLSPEKNTAPVATRSTPQVRESINTKGLGQWRKYADQLEHLRALLARSSE